MRNQKTIQVSVEIERMLKSRLTPAESVLSCLMVAYACCTDGRNTQSTESALDAFEKTAKEFIRQMRQAETAGHNVGG